MDRRRTAAFEMLEESQTFKFQMQGGLVPRPFKIEARDIILKNFMDLQE